MFRSTVCRKIASRLSLGLLLILSCRTPFPPPPTTPALVMVIVIDQMRADYLDRFGSYFVRDGFNRFLRGGAVFTHARYGYVSTVTAASHASISTGHEPREHGIIGDSWFDRSKNRSVTSVEDSAVRGVGVPPNARPGVAACSPNKLCSDTIGDRLKEKFHDTRVVSISLKDRSAILLGGRKADAVVWFDEEAGRFVTSTYYPPHTELLAFNRELPAFFERHRTWEPSQRISAAEWQRITFDPQALFRFKNGEKMGVTFPHPLRNPIAVISSPYGDQLILQFARFVIAEWKLGQNRSGHPDLLFISMTSPDLYGHPFGPDSKEVADGVLRLDGTLQDFFSWLDQTLGHRVLLFLTADHGLTPIPEITRAKLHEENHSDVAGRFDIETNGLGKTSALAPERLLLEKHLAEKFHYTLDENQLSPVEGAVRASSNACLYLNQEVVERRGIPVEAVKEEARDWVKTRPGVLAAYTNTEIGNGLPDSAPFASKVMRSFRPDRSGDVLIVLRPHWIWNVGPGTIGTGHGNPFEDDAHVPLLVWGTKVKKGKFEEAVSPLSIAKTIAAIFHVKAGAEDVEVLQQVLGK